MPLLQYNLNLHRKRFIQMRLATSNMIRLTFRLHRINPLGMLRPICNASSDGRWVNKHARGIQYFSIFLDGKNGNDEKHGRHFSETVKKNTSKSFFKNRWLMLIPAFATNVCIGSPWAWSIMGDILTREVGFVAPVAADWSLAEVIPNVTDNCTELHLL